MLKHLNAWALAATASLILTACGEDAGDSAPQSGPIEIIQIAPIESQVISLPFMESSAHAAVDQINADGGVKGRDIKLTVCNNKYDSNETLRCAQKAVKSKAVAVVGTLSGHGAQLWPLLEKANMPALGTNVVTPPDGASPMSYLIDPGTVSYAAMPALAKSRFGADKIVGMHYETPATPDVIKMVEAGAKLTGVEVVKNITVPLDAVDYAPFIAQAENSGAEAIVSTQSPEFNLKMWKALKSSDSDLKVVASAGGVAEQIIMEAGATADGDYSVAGTPNAAADNPTGQQYLAEMAKYSPDEKVFAGVGLRAWASVHLFADVANLVDGDLTRDSLVDALDEVDGMKFMWLDALAFDKPGTLKGQPRVTTTTVFPIRIEAGAFKAEDSFDPFADQ